VRRRSRRRSTAPLFARRRVDATPAGCTYLLGLPCGVEAFGQRSTRSSGFSQGMPDITGSPEADGASVSGV
jgi:hypothetical protein